MHDAQQSLDIGYSKTQAHPAWQQVAHPATWQQVAQMAAPMVGIASQRENVQACTVPEELVG